MAKTATKTAPAAKPVKEKKEKAPREPKLLTTSQLRIMQALSKAKGPLTRGKINEACAKAGFATAEKFSAWMTEPLGQATAEARAEWEEKKGKKSLLSLGYVKQRELDVDGKKETVFEATATGVKILTKAEAQEAAK